MSVQEQRERVSYLVIAFVGGLVVMMLEMAAGRVLAPYFGYSIHQWGGLIGVVLTALTVGNYLGGKVGDTRWGSVFLLWALAISAGYTIAGPALASRVLPHLQAYGPLWGPALATVALFAVPALLLGTVVSVAARFTYSGGLASTAGRVYAFSNAGSIGGTFLAAFYTIPTLGTTATYYLAGVVLIGAIVQAVVVQKRYRYFTAVALLGLLGLPQVPIAIATNYPTILYQGESVHNIIKVAENAEARVLLLNQNVYNSTYLPKDSFLTGRYYDYFLLAPALTGAKNLLFLGVAGGVSLTQLVRAYPDLVVDGVELDPEVARVAYEYFNLGAHPRIRTIVGDARWYVQTARPRYDVIALDLYVSGQIPFYTATKEFFRETHQRLMEHGVLIMNILTLRSGDILTGALVRTVSTVFPSIFLIDTGRGNTILLATKDGIKITDILSAWNASGHDPRIRPLMQKAAGMLRTAVPDTRYPVFTDDRSDVEFRTAQVLATRRR